MDSSVASGRQRLGEKIAEQLVHDIVSGVYPPGSLLPPEWELAERAAVSRLTIREAMGILRQKSVVQVQAGRGTLVLGPEWWSPFDPVLLSARSRARGQGDEMTLVLEARRFVEAGAAELASERRTDANLLALESALAQMREAGEDVQVFVRADLAFHDAIMSAAQNPILVALFAPIGELLFESGLATSQDAAARRRVYTEHARILNAVRRGDAAAAYQDMRDHIQRTERRLKPAKRARSALRPTAQPDSGN